MLKVASLFVVLTACIAEDPSYVTVTDYTPSEVSTICLTLQRKVQVIEEQFGRNVWADDYPLSAEQCLDIAVDDKARPIPFRLVFAP
jgi:hypothetical protein